jgi:fibronectin-binding autotransporter adhesin
LLFDSIIANTHSGANVLGLTKLGTNTLTLDQNNTYTGRTVISTGILQLGNGSTTGSLSTSSTILNNGTLTINRSNAVAQGTDFSAAPIVGTGAFIQAGAGTTTLNAANAFSGTTTVSSGVLNLSHSLALQNSALVTTGAGTLTITGPTTLTLGGLNGASGNLGTIIASGYSGLTALTLNPLSGSVTYGGVIADGAAGMSLIKTGAGTQILSGNNTYTGATIVNGSTLTVGSGTNGSISSSSTLQMGGGIFNYSRTGTGEFTTGNVTTLLTNLATGINNNGLRAGSNIGFDTTNAAGGTFTVANNIDNSTGTGSGSLGVTKLGSGTLILSGTNTFTGTLTVANGALSVATINNASSNGTLGNSSSAVLLGSTGATGSLRYTGSTASTTRAFTAVAGGTGRIEVTDSNATLTLAGTLTATGGLTFGGAGNFSVGSVFATAATGTVTKEGTGTLTLSGTAAHNGAFVINQGTLNITSGSAFANATSLTLATGVTLNNTSGALVAITNGNLTKTLGTSLTYLGSGGFNLSMGAGSTALTSDTTFNIEAHDLNFIGTTTGSGRSITKEGAGTLRFVALQAGALAGDSYVNEGTLRLAGTSTVNSNVRFIIGNGGILSIDSTATFNGTYTQTGTGQIISESNVIRNIDAEFSGNTTLTMGNTSANGKQTLTSNSVVSSISDWLGTTPGSFTADRVTMQNNATLRSLGNINIAENKGILLSGSTANFDASTNAINISSQVSGKGKLVVQGSSGGFVSLLGTSNSYSGGTEIQSGTLGIMGDGSLGASGTGVSIGNGAVLATPEQSDNSTVTINSNRGINLASSGTGTIAAHTTSTLRIEGVISGTNANLQINQEGVREGTVILAGTNTYSGTTTVSAGTLYVTGALANSAVIVENGAAIGSSGSAATLGNGLNIAAGGKLDLTGVTVSSNSSGVLSISSGNLTLGNLSFADIIGWDWQNASMGTYRLIDGDFTIQWGSTTYRDAASAYDFGNGMKGYFTQGSLNVVIIPETSSALFAALGAFALLRRRREHATPA